MKRCRWADPNLELYIAYHDNEWGRPEHDDRKLFEMLTLEGFQAGLSWLMILKKREAFRRAFDNFQPDVIVQYGPEKVEALMADAGIVRFSFFVSFYASAICPLTNPAAEWILTEPLHSICNPTLSF